MIRELNKVFSVEENCDIEDLIQCLQEREEFICTGDACAAHACGAYQI